ncbi:MAG: alpha/beta hydrolase [Pseudomonadota bacterium]
MRIVCLFLVLLLAACAPVPRPTSAPLIYQKAEWDRADSAVIAIPGALTSIRAMTPALTLAAPGRAVAFYRLPGYDGRPPEDFINLAFAADHIATQVTRAGLRRVDLIGHSTGGVIALEAAKEIRRRAPETQVNVAAISMAMPAPQPVLAGIRGALGTLAAATRAGSAKPKDIWLEYYRTLAYGDEVRTEPEVAAAADDLVAANTARIELPKDGLARRHTRDLRRWTNPDPGALAGVDITLYHGAEDPVFPPRVVHRFARRLPSAQVDLIDGHGHLLMLTYPEIWGRIGDQLGD